MMRMLMRSQTDYFPKHHHQEPTHMQKCACTAWHSKWLCGQKMTKNLSPKRDTCIPVKFWVFHPLA